MKDFLTRCGILDSPVANLKADVSNISLLPLRVDIVNLPTDHVLDDFGLGHRCLSGIHGTDRSAVPQYRNGIRDFYDFLQSVRNHDAGNALFLQFSNQLQQVLAVILIQG